MARVGRPSLCCTRMVNQFTQDATTCIAEVEQAVTNGDPARLAEAAHGLKGICRNIGANRLAELCYQLEQKGRRGATHEALTFLHPFTAEWQRTRQALEATDA